MSRRVFVVAVALVASSCARPLPVEREAAARGLVERFFGALPRGDCDELASVLVEDEGRRCAAVVAELNRHGLRLIEVLDARPDGRDAHAVLVRARVSAEGKPRGQPMLLRVEERSGRLRLRI